MAHLKDFHGVEDGDFFEQDRGFQTLLADLLAQDEGAQIFFIFA